MTEERDYTDDTRTAAELATAWKARPERLMNNPLEYARLTEIRSALFAKLHTPTSIKAPKGRK